MREEYGKMPEGKTILETKLLLSKANQKLIDKFIDNKRGSVVDGRLRLLFNSLVKFGYFLELDFNKAKKDDITQAWNIILSSSLSIKTKQDEYLHIRQAFKYWFGEDDEFPKVVKGMKRPKSRGHLRLPSEMPTEDIIHKAIKICQNSRDKFLVAFPSLDSATRPIENENLKWGSLQKDKHGYFFRIKTAKESGDSEYRTIRVINSEPYLIKWMEDYPGEKDEDKYIFTSLDNSDIKMTRGAVTSLFKRLKAKLNIKTKFSPYTLRHLCLTRLSKDPNAPISLIKKLAGHTTKSNIIGEYQHFGDDDVGEMQLIISGKDDIKQDKSFELKKTPKKCPHCKKSNAYDSEVCGFCNFALSQNREVTTPDDVKENLEKKIEAQDKSISDLKELVKITMDALENKVPGFKSDLKESEVILKNAGIN